jgi:arginyl-tRNA synthetase
MNIIAQLQEVFAPALSQLGVDPTEYLGLIRPSQAERTGADYQFNGAMALAKQRGEPPAQVAASIVAALPPNPIFEPPTISGPGFINLHLRDEWLAERVREQAADPRLGVCPVARPRRYVVDYSGPNVAKPLHVGHLRSTIIGESICRILRFLGHTVIGDNHLGDWGTQFGMLIYGYKHYLDAEAYAADPVRELARLYVHVRNLTKGKVDPDDEAAEAGQAKLTPEQQALVTAYRQETAKLHAGDPENVAIWRQFMPHCLEEIEAIYRRLDVHFDEMLGESFYNPALPGVVADLLAKGIAEPSQGAVIVALDPEKKRVALIRKGDGAYTYMTTDLATIQYRVQEWHPDALLYVVDFRQADHFKILFETARRWGYDHLELQHLQFGAVLGPDGKPLKSRDGGVLELEELLNEAVAHGVAKYREIRQQRLERGEEVPDLSEQEIQQIAETVGYGAVKYADLSQNRTSNYRFDWKKMLATDGNTATYMQYAYTRCRGIVRKSGIDEARLREQVPPIRITHPAERALALQLLRFEEALLAAATDYMPHLLTDYLWNLSKALSALYEGCSVLQAETAELRDGRLVLCDLTARILRQSLYLLGIRTLERM